ncbi:MAG: response regulator [Clostridia bacterium]
MAKKGSIIRVLVVDDIITFRERFCEILKTDEKILVVGVANTGKQAVEMALKERPDIILMDIMMEDDTAGIQAAQTINERLSNVKIIISTVLEGDEIVFNAFQTGAVDYLLKNSNAQEVLNAVHAAYNDQSPIRPNIAKKIRKEFKKMRTYQSSIMYTLNIIRTLTHAELDILLLLCEGKTRNNIAQIRCIEISTVKTHISNILKKFKKKNTNEIIHMLRDMEMIDIIKQGIEV